MQTKEKNYEEFIEKFLTTYGGYVKDTASAFDNRNGIITSDLLTFIKQTQPKEWKKVTDSQGSQADTYFVERLKKNIDEHGLLFVLRKGVKLNGATIELLAFKPENNINPDTVKLYDLNICKLVRQLHYSYQNKNSIDTVLFINGFPLVTIELKNEFTGQTYANAIKQYKYDRDPQEIIFQFNKRSLVHFAVDLQEVYMTTKLTGGSTRFLPFNQGSNGAGNDGGKGNPNNESSFLTSYLWEQVLSKDSLFDILKKFVQLEVKKNKKTGAVKQTLIFPRYHQLDVVRKLIADTRFAGSGKNYLIQHSAGSGKSNSIAWLAYRLATLHDAKDKAIFDSVIVITDRKVLDQQLQDNIYQFEHTTGFIEKIDKNKTSKDLLKAVNNGKKIIITTLQKFPIIYKDIEAADKRFAVIVDEAHSSQTGNSAKKLKAGLGDLEEAIRIESELEQNFVDDEDKMLNELASHGQHKNLSFFAFTATPKHKTLQIFGRKTETGSYVPHHIYSMRQAIEEGFILDVLQNYMTYSTFYKLVKKTNEDPEFEAGRGIKELIRFETLHPTNITQKTAIIIEQFLNTTSKKIGGQAKAMVVTPSRLHAVRYVHAFKKYIQTKSLADKLKVLVAFSGDVFDPDLKESFTEVGINKISESQLPDAFEEEYNVLIVAEKYQTGFDQPLLHTMFVDKKLAGIKAVQTLSRLNRTCEGKTDTFVLDFVNKAEDIQTAFQDYYQATVLTEGFDVNNIYDIYSRLEAYQIVDKKDIDGFATAYYSNTEDMSKLSGFLYKAKEKYIQLEKADKLEFKNIMQAFLRNYNFVVQVARMNDKELQSAFVYYKYLNQFLPKEHTKTIDVKDLVELEFFKVEKKFEGSISLVKEQGEIDPPTGYIGKKGEEIKVKLSEIITKINQKYQTKFTNMDKVFEQIEKDYLDDDRMRAFAQNNEEKDFKKVYDKEFENKAINRYEQNSDLFKILFTDEEFMDDVKTALFKAIYEKLRSGNKQA
ncbi:MAG: type I restriction endonuclease [Firmicutes bacterium]|nr:type I restriction endonuclease [Bacillota bacterium]